MKKVKKSPFRYAQINYYSIKSDDLLSNEVEIINMYKIKVEQRERSDTTIQRYESALVDIANTIPDKIDDVADESVTIENDIISFHSSCSESEVKNLLWVLFSYHCYEVAFISISKG